MHGQPVRSHPAPVGLALPVDVRRVTNAATVREVSPSGVRVMSPRPGGGHHSWHDSFGDQWLRTDGLRWPHRPPFGGAVSAGGGERCGSVVVLAGARLCRSPAGGDRGRSRPQPFILQTHRPGEEAEIDFGEFWIRLAGVPTKVLMFALRMSFSVADIRPPLSSHHRRRYAYRPQAAKAGQRRRNGPAGTRPHDSHAEVAPLPPMEVTETRVLRPPESAGAPSENRPPYERV